MSTHYLYHSSKKDPGSKPTIREKEKSIKIANGQSSLKNNTADCPKQKRKYGSHSSICLWIQNAAKNMNSTTREKIIYSK